MPQQAVAQTILNEIGWNNSFAIPVANAENKRLEDEILNRKKQLLLLQGKVAQDGDRVVALQEHLKNVCTELDHTQALRRAQVKALDTEVHLQKVAERETGRIRQELGKLDKDLQDQKEKKNFFENTVFRQTQRMEEKKSQMNWDNQALEAWLKECRRRDDDAMTLARYTREDEDKIREINLKINNMTEELAKKKRQLDHENMETQTAQVELDKTAEEFRKAHQERQELLHRWEQTIDQMARRDDEMNILALELETTKAEVRSKENQCKEKAQFLQDEVANNQDIEEQIKRASRDVARVKVEFQQAEKQRDEFQSEVETLKRTVDRTASDLEGTRVEVTQQKQEIVEKNKKLGSVKSTVEDLRAKLQRTIDSKMTAAERSARLIELLEQEERSVVAMNLELKRLRDTHYSRTGDLERLKSECKSIETEIQGERSKITNLNSKIHEFDKAILRQEEDLYKQDFDIQALQRRLSRMEGEQSNEEKVAHEARVRELTKLLREKTSIRTLLTGENKRQQDEVRKVKHRLEFCANDKEDLKKKIDELELHINNAQRVLKRSTNEKQDLMVDKNLLELRIKKLRDELHRQAGEVLTQEKRRLQLETAMKERRLEIDVHIKMLVALLRSAEDQRRDTNMQLQELITKIERLMKRYESLIVVMAPPEGEEEHSQAYYVIRAAQEKNQLQTTGDQLDKDIRKRERELCALRNTVKVVRSSNEVLRKDQTKVQDSGDEMQEKHVLEEQLKTIIDKYRHKRGLLRELQEDMQRMTQNQDVIASEEEVLAETVEEKKAKILQLQKDLEDQTVKLDRVTKLNSRLLREIRNMRKVKELEEEHDINLRELRELNKNALKQISESLQKLPELAPSVQQYCEQAGLPVPSPSIPGSRSSSSSVSSIRSSLMRSGSMSSVRSTSSHGSIKSEREAKLIPKESTSTTGQFKVFGDDLLVKPPSTPSSQSSRSKPPSSRRLASSKSSGSIKEFTIFGDDLVVQGSGHSSASLNRSVHSQPILTREAKSDGSARGSTHSLRSSRPSSVTRSKAKSTEDANAARTRQESLSRGSSKRSSIEAFTVFGEPAEIRVPSRESSDAGGSSRRSSQSGRK